jgi:N-methylhydantoinase A/oxoprolinase/acetone carboxylase beta subunit
MTDHPNVVAFDMGGTTAKLALIRDGVPDTVSQFELHKVDLQTGSGIPMSVRSIDLVEIGAGGGSIAGSNTGTIQVGPESAGSSPGPACYGLGGTRPTVTDANLVLGYLNPVAFAGGSITLDVDAANEAIAREVATPLNLTVAQAAWGIHRIVNLNMELATRVVSIDRGYDPRDLALVATGGAGPVHACRLASALGMPTVVVPGAAGVASAIGMLAADIKFDVSRSLVGELIHLASGSVNRLLHELEAEAVETIRESGVGGTARLVREVELRYVGQGYELSVEVPAGLIDAAVLGEVRQSFDMAYEARYGFSSPDQRVEATTWKVTAYGSKPLIGLQRLDHRHSTDSALRETRPVYFPEFSGYVPTPAYAYEFLGAGGRLEGPAVIEQAGSTVVVPPRFDALVDDHGTIVLRDLG